MVWISQEHIEIKSHLINKSSSSVGRVIGHRKTGDQHDDIWFSFRCLDIPVTVKEVRPINSPRPTVGGDIEDGCQISENRRVPNLYQHFILPSNHLFVMT